MTPRQRRMSLVAGIVVGVGIAGALALSAFKSNVTFFFDPTAVAAGQVKTGEHFRLGGMVTQGSVKRSPGSLEVHFVVTDFKHDVPVTYSGVLPDLFREGTGVVANGSMQSDGTFKAAVNKFGEQGVIDLTGVAGYYTMLAMILGVAGQPLPSGVAPPLPVMK